MTVHEAGMARFADRCFLHIFVGVTAVLLFVLREVTLLLACCGLWLSHHHRGRYMRFLFVCFLHFPPPLPPSPVALFRFLASRYRASTRIMRPLTRRSWR